ncbi:MAG: TetR family transcriptional regulator, partial [Solirubrobacteraceae bacterium]|nr:TetR family transcriptional regulator [Solirubrobacteraceae bacterium]
MSTSRVPAAEARQRILTATRELLLEQPFSQLTVGKVMTRAQLTRTAFYRHWDDLPQMAPDLLPDEDDPLVDQVTRIDTSDPQAVVRAMVDGLVATYAEHGPLLRAIDDAARHDEEVAQRLDAALAGPRRLIAQLVAA